MLVELTEEGFVGEDAGGGLFASEVEDGPTISESGQKIDSLQCS
jgi:hypothetical protein